MCKDCGCAEAGRAARTELEHAHDPAPAHSHAHTHAHAEEHVHVDPHAHDPAHTRAHAQERSRPSGARGKLEGRALDVDVLAKNRKVAASNRAWLDAHCIFALDLISSPGAGKTTLLEKTVELLRDRIPLTILTGDVEHDFDAKRLTRAGARVKQLNTRGACHLDARQLERELGHFVRPEPGLLLIENVGNLVCPAAFQLGEHAKVVLLSTTEGEDKPRKYPLAFHEASAIILAKLDLAPHLEWDAHACEQNIRSVNARAPVLRLSARTGVGMDAWLAFLERCAQRAT